MPEEPQQFNKDTYQYQTEPERTQASSGYALPQNLLTKEDIVKIVGVAAAIDAFEFVLQFIPVIGWMLIPVVDVLAWLTLYLMFKKRGVKFNNFKRFMYFNSGLILDLIPFINTFAWTVDVIMVISTVKKEEGAFKPFF